MARMATCPKDGEPVVMTLEFPGAEFICMKCRAFWDFIAPVGVEPTPDLNARYVEHRAAYDIERAARRREAQS